MIVLKEEARRKLLEIVGEYDAAVSYVDLDESQKKEVDALNLNLSEMLKEALAEGQNVDYREVSFILGRLSALQKPELIPTVINNLERLYPVAHSIAAFFKPFSALDQPLRDSVAQALLGPLLNNDSAKPSEYYCIWVGYDCEVQLLKSHAYIASHRSARVEVTLTRSRRIFQADR